MKFNLFIIIKMKFNILISTLVLVSLIITKTNGQMMGDEEDNGYNCLHPDEETPEQTNCGIREGNYITIYTDNGCSSHSLCLIPTGNNQIFPESYKAKKFSECIEIEDIAYCAADLVSNIPCEQCSFPKLMNKLKEISEGEFNFEFSKNTKVKIPPAELGNEKIQCVIDIRYIIDEYEKCQFSDGIFIQHEFYPNCEQSYYACFYLQNRTNNEDVDPNVIVEKDKSNCLKGDGLTYCGVGYTNIDCKNCSFTEFTKKAKEIFGDYLDKEIGTVSNKTKNSRNYVLVSSVVLMFIYLFYNLL